MTGTFDDWAKSEKLEKKGDYFEKLVELPLSKEKIYYKVRSFTASQVESPPACYLQTMVKYQGCIRISSAMSNAAHAARSLVSSILSRL